MYNTREEAQQDGWRLQFDGGAMDNDRNPMVVYQRGNDIMCHKFEAETISDAVIVKDAIKHKEED